MRNNNNLTLLRWGGRDETHPAKDSCTRTRKDALALKRTIHAGQFAWKSEEDGPWLDQEAEASRRFCAFGIWFELRYKPEAG